MTTFSEHCLHQLPYPPTGDQVNMMQQLEGFVFHSPPNGLFIMKGSAGTGKTTLISLLVNNLGMAGLKCLLLAPTGRAAKVMSAYSGMEAGTIHRKIYSARNSQEGIHFALAENRHSNTIFLIDEASMIADVSSDGIFQGRNLLEDIIDYVYSGHGCKIIFSGDLAQLPPVGYDMSPALDAEYLSNTFNLTVNSFVLSQVVRQSAESGILFNAENLRSKLQKEDSKLPLFHLEAFKDIKRVTHAELAEDLMSHCHYGELEDTIVVTRSNKMANLYNQQIRARLLFREGELDAGDQLMIVKNNYFWLQQQNASGFLANGDTFQILRVKKIEEMYTMRFADVNISLPDFPDEADLEVKIFLDTLTADGPSLPKELLKSFHNEVLKDYEHLNSKREVMAELRKNPWYNALQAKFSYAITCHKTQGGQWQNVFVDHGFITAEKVDKEYLRWIYTALTRSTAKVYLVNFPEEFYG